MQLASNPYRADADEIERRVEARIRARMESATRSILGRATRPKPAEAQAKSSEAQAKPTGTQVSPAVATAESSEAQVKPTAAQAEAVVVQAEPVLNQAKPVTVQPNSAPDSRANTSPAVAQIAPEVPDQAPPRPKLETNDLAKTNGTVTTSVTDSPAVNPA